MPFPFYSVKKCLIDSLSVLFEVYRSYPELFFSGALTQARGSVGGFRVLFWVSFAIYALSAAVFAGCATVDRDTSLYECGGGSGGSRSGSGAVVRRPTTTPDGPDRTHERERGMIDTVPLLAAPRRISLS